MKNVVVLFSFLIYNTIYCQDIRLIKGYVTFDDIPLESVNVKNISTNDYTVTDGKGIFYLNSKVGDTLFFTYLGMKNLKRNIITNASYHTNKKYVFNLDLEDFFNAVTFGRVKSVLKLSPFNLSEQAAHLIANLCCDNGTLPQGVPTSPMLTNIVCQRLDRKLVQFVKANPVSGSSYTELPEWIKNTKSCINIHFCPDT